MGALAAKRPFPDGPKTTFNMLAMVISIVMTIAATLKTDLGRTENEGEKGANSHQFAKGYYFCYLQTSQSGPDGLENRPGLLNVSEIYAPQNGCYNCIFIY